MAEWLRPVTSPLQGITVIEVASFIAGPYAGSLLADLGADVIKVEAPDGGDPFRGWDTGGESASFWAYNRGKRSITLNLREPAAIDIMRQLIRSADVLLENMRPGAMDRLGLGYAELSAINSRPGVCVRDGLRIERTLPRSPGLRRHRPGAERTVEPALRPRVDPTYWSELLR